jgi:enoyl-CoA hydratase/carnithine racemase
MASDSIIYEKAGPRATIWLNNPEAKNAMTIEMSKRFREAVVEACLDPDVRVIVYRGKGDDFCAGSSLEDLDVDNLGKLLTSFDPETENGLPSVFKGTLPIDNDKIPKVTIAVVHGYAVGGGFEIMCDADLAVAADDARIGDVHIRRGLIGGAGVLANIARMAGARRTKELVLTGKTLTGKQAAEWGLVNSSVPLGELDAEVDSLVAELAQHSPRVTRLVKMAYGRSLDADKNTLGVLETMMLLSILRSDDAREGVESFLEKRPAVWTSEA